MLEDGRRYEIRSHADCCGCWMLYANLYRNGVVAAQFITEMGCAIYEPTLHLLRPDTATRIMVLETMILVTDSTFTVVPTNAERRVLAALDTANMRAGQYYANHGRRITFGNFTGFRIGQHAHFPVGILKSLRGNH